MSAVVCDQPDSSTPPVLPDIVAPDLDVLFVGFNPSPASARLGHHYAGRNNQFWKLLAASGLTPGLLAWRDDALLPQWALGSTNLVRRPTTGSSDLPRSELRAGTPRLAELLKNFSPKVLAYTGKGVYLAAAGKPTAPWGRQSHSIFEGVLDFVLPSPSGKARIGFEAKLRHYQDLASLVGHLEDQQNL